MTFIQGLVAGGAAVYLQNRLAEEAAEKNPDTWTTRALQMNHILLLTAETLTLAGRTLGPFKNLVQFMYIITPLSLTAWFCKISLSPEEAELANTVYRVAMASLSLGALALGDPLFAAGSLSMLAMDLAVSGPVRQAFLHLSKIPALCAFVGYGSQVFSAALSSPPNSACIAAVGSTVLMGLKLCFIDPLIFLAQLMPESGGRSSLPHQYPVYVGHHHVDHYSPSAPSHSFGGGNLFCRNTGVWA